MELLLTKQTVLIVDDNERNIQLIASLFNKYSINCAFAQSASEAIEKLGENLFSLVLLDILMPGEDGFEACRKIKETPELSNIPIIFLSAKGDEESIIKGFELGAQDFVSKPFNEQELISRVKAHLSIKEYRDMLEEMVKAEVEERRQKEEMLIQQSKMAEMGEMIGFIEHQWKNLLHNVTLHASLMRWDFESKIPIEPEIRNHVVDDFDELIGKLNFMSKTLSDFRSFLKPSRNKGLFFVPLAVKEAIRLMDAKIMDFGVSIVMEESDESCEILGFKNEFIQVVINILSNAIDAIKENKVFGGKITVRHKIEGDRIVLEIQDNGGGIPASLLPDKVFKPYLSTKDEGSGIGLYMARSIIKMQFGGDILVTNKDGGALFSIILQCA